MGVNISAYHDGFLSELNGCGLGILLETFYAGACSKRLIRWLTEKSQYNTVIMTKLFTNGLIMTTFSSSLN